MRIFAVLFFLSTAAFGQFSFGAKVGAPLTDAYDIARGGSIFTPGSHDFVIGPTIEVGIPIIGLGLEFDALYRRYSYNYTSGSSTGPSGALLTAETKTGAWEFPILLKYKTPIPLVKPYAVGGLAFNKLTGIKRALACIGTCTQDPNDVKHNTSVGLVLGGGIQINALLLKISPEIRYTRWGFSNFDFAGASGSALKTEKNQLQFLVGFTF